MPRAQDRWVVKERLPIQPLGRFVLTIVGVFLAAGKVACHKLVVEKGACPGTRHAPGKIRAFATVLWPYLVMRLLTKSGSKPPAYAISPANDPRLSASSKSS